MTKEKGKTIQLSTLLRLRLLRVIKTKINRYLLSMQCWRRPPLIFYFYIFLTAGLPRCLLPAHVVFDDLGRPKWWEECDLSDCGLMAIGLTPQAPAHTGRGEDGINFPHHPASLCITLASTSIASTHALTIPQTDRGGSWPWNPKTLRHQSSTN